MSVSPLLSAALARLSATPSQALSVDGVAEVVRVLRLHHRFGDRHEIVSVVAHPAATLNAENSDGNDSHAPGNCEGESASEALAVVVDRKTGITYEAIVSLELGRLLAWQPILDVRPSEPQPLASGAGGNGDDYAEGGLHFGDAGAALWRHAWMVVGMALAVSIAATAKSLTDVPIYSGEFELLTEPAAVETQIISTALPDSVSNRSHDAAELAKETQLKILTSPRLLQPMVEQFQQRFPDVTYEQFEKALRVNTAGGDAQVLNVKFRHLDPEAVSFALDLVSQSFIQYSIDERQTGIAAGMTFVEAQLPTLRLRSQSLQDRLQALRQQSATLDPEDKGTQLTQQLGTFETQRLETQIQLDELNAVRADLARSLTEGSGAATSLFVLNENPSYQFLLERLSILESELAAESSRFKLDGPGLESMQRQRGRLLELLRREKQRILDEVDSRIRELEARDRALTATVTGLQQKIEALSASAREYSEVQQELSIVRGNLNSFLSKREAFRVDAAQQEVSWKVLTPPTQPEPTPVNALRNAFLGAFLGLLLGCGFALGIDKLKDKLHSPKAIKQLTQLSLLGIIPRYRRWQRHAVSAIAQMVLENSHNGTQKLTTYGSSPFHEAFRSLYANIRVSRGGQPIRSLAVSSAISGEGKTTVAIQLAQAAASIGKKVLLVDADLRSAMSANVSQSKGLTDVLDVLTEGESVLSLVRPSRVDRNLFVMTRGSQDLDPLQLFAASEFRHVLSTLQAAFDFVVYDTPSLLGLADAQVLAADTDGLLLVAELDRLKQSQFQEALEELELFRTRTLGIVVNGARKPKSDRLLTPRTYTSNHLLTAET